MPGFKSLYKIFCVQCEWFVHKKTDKELYSKYAACPKCGGATDAFKEGTE